MDNIIKIPCFTAPNTLHWGSSANYSRFVDSYFILKDSGDSKYIYKHIIMEVKYKPDEFYRMHDGYFGNCWLVKINNNENHEFETYYIRNWIDIVHAYEEKGYILVDESNKKELTKKTT